MARRNGRAPKAGSKPFSIRKSVRLGRHDELDLVILEALLHLAEQDLHDLHHVMLGELAEHDDVVDAVQELGIERALDLVHDPAAHGLVLGLSLLLGAAETKLLATADLTSTEISS